MTPFPGVCCARRRLIFYITLFLADRFLSDQLFESNSMSSSRGELLAAEVAKMEKKVPFFGKRGHQQKTADKMVQCANAYRAERSWVKAGEMYYRAALLYKTLDEGPTAAKAAADSAKMYAKDPTYHTETMQSLHLGCDLFKEQKRKMNAADLLLELARILGEEGQFDKSVEVVNEAVELYKEDKAESKAASCLEGLADSFSERQEYVQSAELYHQVALMRLQQTLTQGSSGPAFFRSMLCSLQANDIVAAKRKLEEYLDKNPAWRRSAECQFLNDIMAKIEAKDIEGFDETVQKYQSRAAADKWVRDVLLDLRKFADDGGDAAIL